MAKVFVDRVQSNGVRYDDEGRRPCRHCDAAAVVATAAAGAIKLFCPSAFGYGQLFPVTAFRRRQHEQQSNQLGQSCEHAPLIEVFMYGVRYVTRANPSRPPPVTDARRTTTTTTTTLVVCGSFSIGQPAPALQLREPNVFFNVARSC